MKMWERVKSIFRAIVFVSLLTFITVGTYNTLSWKDSAGILGLNRAKADSIDVLFLGSSHSFCTINTALLWKDYGIAAQDISDGGQILAVSYHYLLEALKTQSPQIVFVEMSGINSKLKVSNGNYYRNTLNMKWSKNYIDNERCAIDNVRHNTREDVNIDAVHKATVLKFPVIHTRYNELSQSDYSEHPKSLRFYSNWSEKSYDTPKSLDETGKVELSEETVRLLDQFQTLSKEHNFTLILWVAPYCASRNSIMVYNALKEYASERGIIYYDFFDLLGETGFSFATDMRKEESYGSHMNNQGARKITNYIGRCLDESFDLTDHRNDKAYSRYEEVNREWIVIDATHNLSVSKSLNDYIRQIDSELFDVTVFVYTEDGEKAMADTLKDSSWDQQSGVPGLYTSASRNKANGVWELSDRIKLSIDGDDIKQAKLYNGSSTMAIKECEVCMIVVDRCNGKLINKAEFQLTDGELIKL